MRRDELHYDLPPELIAQQPVPRRDASRLLVLDRGTGRCRHGRFDQLAGFLPDGALLVLNDTRVIPAKFTATRESGGRVRGLFLRELGLGQWLVLLQGRGRLQAGQRLTLGDAEASLTLTHRGERGAWQVEVAPVMPAEAILARCGCTPLPPYIRRPDGPSAEDEADRERYQTIYARRAGAVAAPTAGLHFTDAVFGDLANKGIERVQITLHVGQGTFAPITVDDLAEHPMHAEWYELPAAVADRINAVRGRGGAIVAVGTTAARVLETCAEEGGTVHAGTGWTQIFIYPPYHFRAVDAMITNFHLPGSTLLAMLYAFAGADLVRAAYQEAVAQRYRFYSYGDAMLVI